MRKLRIESVLAHEGEQGSQFAQGEDLSRDKQVAAISPNSTATTIIYIFFVLVILIGGSLLLYNYGKRHRK